MECPSCGSPNAEAKRFCGDCGAMLPIRCVACGAENLSGKRFCGDCGAALTGSVRASEAAEPSTFAASPVAELSAVPLRPSPTAERRQLTVMFCDLVDFTALSTRLDPEDLREVIGAYHKCVAEVISHFQGFVANTWATASWPISAIPRPMRMMPSALCAPAWL